MAHTPAHPLSILGKEEATMRVFADGYRAASGLGTDSQLVAREAAAMIRRSRTPLVRYSSLPVTR